MSHDLKNARVSVIVPAFRHPEWLSECLEALLGQTLDAFEVIVVDDCSPISFAPVYDRWRLRLRERQIDFRVVRHDQNLGVGEARNTGIRQAHGDVVAFLDHDDIWDRNHLEFGLRTLNEADADVAFSSSLFFSHVSRDEREFIGVWGPFAKELDDFPQSLGVRSFLQPSSVLIRKDFCARLDGFGPAPLEDLDYWLQLVVGNAKFAYSSSVTVLCRRGQQDGLSSDASRLIVAHADVLWAHRNLCTGGVEPGRHLLWERALFRYNVGAMRRAVAAAQPAAVRFGLRLPYLVIRWGIAWLVAQRSASVKWGWQDTRIYTDATVVDALSRRGQWFEPEILRGG